MKKIFYTFLIFMLTVNAALCQIEEFSRAINERSFVDLTNNLLPKYESGDTTTIYDIDRLELILDNYIKHWNYANAVHKINIVKGLMALEKDNINLAKEFLKNSINLNASAQLKTFGPNMSLVNELLMREEYLVVIHHLEECRAFWELGGDKLDLWIEQIKNNEMPQFGANLFY